MTKKRVITTSLVLILLMSTIAYGADLLWRLTHGEQYALVLGTVEKVDEDWIKIKVKDILDGRQVEQELKILVNKKTNKYNPEEKDYIVASIDKGIFNYVLKHGLFKVSSLDYRKLTIEKGFKFQGDNVALQWYINSGCKDNNFYFNGNKAYVRKDNGQEIQIYPEKSDYNKNKSDEKDDVNVSKVEKENTEKKETKSLFSKISSVVAKLALVGVFLLLIIRIIYFIKRRYY